MTANDGASAELNVSEFVGSWDRVIKGNALLRYERDTGIVDLLLAMMTCFHR
jgi:hypothetical protein